MQKPYNGLEKIICFGLAAVFVLSSCLFMANNSAYRSWITRKTKALAFRNINNVSGAKSSAVLPLVNNEAEEIDLLKIKRNIFIPFKDDDNTTENRAAKLLELELIDVSYKPLDFQYQGRIVYPDGQIVAQVNANNKSYLVKKGESIGQYKVVGLDNDSVTLKNKEHDSLTIRYLQTAFSNELMAKIKDRISGNIETVYKNSNIYSYKVLDIEEDSVLLSKSGQHLRLQKGMVQAQ